MSLPRTLLEIILYIQDNRNSLFSHRVGRKLIELYEGNSGHNLKEDGDFLFNTSIRRYF